MATRIWSASVKQIHARLGNGGLTGGGTVTRAHMHTRAGVWVSLSLNRRWQAVDHARI